MAEGVARLNQQVVSTGYWDQFDRVHSLDESAPSGQPAAIRHVRSDPRSDEIRRAVEADIIPRLLLGREQAATFDLATHAAGALDEAEIRVFAGLLLCQNEDRVVLAHLDGLRARGLSLDVLYLDLFQPAARHIGELWHADLCTFVDVTLAIGTMQKLLRTFGPDFHKNGRPADGSRQALLAPLPGDQHTFGLSMVAEFFRRGGWSVWSTPYGSLADLDDLVQGTWFAVVGFSVSREDRLDELAAVVRMVRRASCNAGVGILVGGPVFVDRPDNVKRVGADVVGRNALQALAQAEGFVTPAAGP